MAKKFKMNKCPWIELKANDQGILFWCEKCGTIYNQEGSWKDNGPTTPTSYDDSTNLCYDRGIIP